MRKTHSPEQIIPKGTSSSVPLLFEPGTQWHYGLGWGFGYGEVDGDVASCNSYLLGHHYAFGFEGDEASGPVR